MGPQILTFEVAVSTGENAARLAKIAASKDDWELVVGKWQQAIAQMQQVPASHASYATAQSKLQEYQANLAAAQQQSSQL
ncbi:MAG: hypothetical protein VKK04_08390 [Synechococcales bacterium]|nr:hypothetical protein [Synechococcales bacterium]